MLRLCLTSPKICRAGIRNAIPTLWLYWLCPKRYAPCITNA